MMLWFGCLQRMILFLLSPFTPLWQIGDWSHSPMAFCGIVGCLQFLLAKQLGPGSWLLISSKGGVEGFLIDATCVRKKKKQVTISSSIVWKLVFWGSWYLCFLVSNGWCILQLERFFWVGMGLLLVKRGRKLGRLLRCVLFGLFGGRGIGELLITMKAWTKLLKILSCIYFGIGLGCILRMVHYRC